jgi:hypothetical protein
MKATGNILKSFLLLCILLVLLFPEIGKETSLFTESPLNGAFVPAGLPQLSQRSWFSGEFQAAYERYQAENSFFHNTLVRARNQVDFSLFNIPDNASIIAGKDGYLYYEEYAVAAFLGKGKLDIAGVTKKLELVMQLQKELKKRNVDFIFAIIPSKIRIYPEFFPSRFDPQKARATNYTRYRDIIRKDFPGLHLIDFTGYLLQCKEKKQIPVFPKGGSHWSNYAVETVVMDSLIRYMESLRHIRMNHYSISCVTRSDSLRWPDYDILAIMNILTTKSWETLPYATLALTKNDSAVKPKLLSVSDSYYWNIYGHPLINELFSRNDYWYYNSVRHPSGFYRDKSSNDTAFMRKDLLGHDVVLLMVSESNLSTLFNFPETALSWLVPGDPAIAALHAKRQQRIEYYRNLIRNDPAWMELIRKKAAEKNATVEETTELDAEFMVTQEEGNAPK